METGETLFFIACFMRELGCGKKRDFLEISQKCYFFIHFPILELEEPVSRPKGRTPNDVAWTSRPQGLLV